MSEPVVSVIITAYNRERVIADAMRSIFRQTLANFELIIVDDGSTDQTAAVVQSFADPRLRVLRHETNRGIPSARNSGLDAARGQFIAWLDSDDVARPRRLARQCQFLRDNPEVAMIGACAGKMTEQGRPFGPVRRPPFSHEQIRVWLLFRSAFQQSSVFGRAAILKRFPYRPEFPVCEDIDVFIRLSREHRLQNLSEVLIDRRIHRGQSVQTYAARVRERKKAIQSGLLSEMGVAWTPDDLEQHVTLGSGSSAQAGHETDFLKWAEAWLERLARANEASAIYERGALRFASAYFWTAAFRHISRSRGGAGSLSQLCSSPLAHGWFTPTAAMWLTRAARSSC